MLQLHQQQARAGGAPADVDQILAPFGLAGLSSAPGFEFAPSSKSSSWSDSDDNQLADLQAELDAELERLASDDGGSAAAAAALSDGQKSLDAETLAKALLEAQDELLERELEEALAEERASDALEADEDDEEDESDADEELSEWEELEVEVEGGGAANSTRRVKGRHGRLANKVRTLRRAVEMRREAQGDDGLRPVTSRSARQASLFLFP